MDSSGRWLSPQDDPRNAIDFGSTEWTVLAGYLNHHRPTIELKCADLTPGQPAEHAGQADLLREAIDGRTGS